MSADVLSTQAADQACDEEIELGEIITGPGMTKQSALDLSGLTRAGQIVLANSSYQFRRSIGIICKSDELSEYVVHSIRAEPLDGGYGYRLFAAKKTLFVSKRFTSNTKKKLRQHRPASRISVAPSALPRAIYERRHIKTAAHKKTSIGISSLHVRMTSEPERCGELKTSSASMSESECHSINH